MENKISVVINTYNEEASLPEILEHVKGFDEILVCDMESTDSTVKIAEEAGCRVVTFPKGDIFHGVSGLLLAVNEANYKFYTLVKIWEARNEGKGE